MCSLIEFKPKIIHKIKNNTELHFVFEICSYKAKSSLAAFFSKSFNY